MKSHYNIAKAIRKCEYLRLFWWGTKTRKAHRYQTATHKLLTLAQKRDTSHTCASCRHWFHKSSTNKHWGRCTNEKVHESTYISFQNIPPGIPISAVMLAAKHSEIRTEENSFGCIHHEPVATLEITQPEK